MRIPQKLSPVRAVQLGMLMFPMICGAQAGAPQTTADVAQIFELSPFVVDAEQDSGYLATQSLAGTRIRSNLRDVAATVSVLTKDLLEDIGADDVTDFLIYTAGGEAGGMGGNFMGEEIDGDNVGADASLRARPQTNLRIRGLLSPDLTRDFFLTDMSSDSYNTERVEVNRGANAILFGLGSPAGVINTSLIRPQFNRDAGQLRFRLGEYGSHRGQFDYNVVAIKDKLALRVAGLYDRLEYQQRPAYQEQKRYYLTGTWRIDDRTNFNFSGEYADIDANRPRVLGPVDRISGWILAGKPYWDMRENFLGARQQARNLDGTPYLENPQGIILDLGMGTVVNSSDAVDLLPFDTQGLGGFSYVLVFEQPNQRDPQGSLGNFEGLVLWPRAGGARHPLLPEGYSNAGRNARWQNSSGIRGMYGGAIEGAEHQGLLNRDMFDWVINMMGGDTALQKTDFKSYNLSLDRVFLTNKNLGVEIAYDYQSYLSDAFSPLQDRFGGFNIDINPVLPFGPEGFFVPNPNYLRPFVTTRNLRREIWESERHAYRGTAFYSYDLSDQFESKWATWLGRGTLTGLVNRQEIEKESYRMQLQNSDPYFARHINSPLGSGFFNNIGHMIYVGPAVDPAAVNTLADIKIEPIRGLDLWNTERMDDYFVFDSGIMPGTTNTRNQGNNAAGAAEILRIAGEDGFGNFRTVSQTARPSVQNPRKTYEVIDTLALNLQQFFFRDHLVFTCGYRKDSLKLQQAGAPDFDADEFDAFIYDSVNVRDMARSTLDVETNTWGVVGYLPERWVKLPYDSQLSFHYGESENFRPELGRIDYLGNPLPDPGGKTREYGFVLSVKEDKFVVRMNWYETKLVNSTSRAATGELNNGWIQRNAFAWRQAEQNLLSREIALDPDVEEEVRESARARVRAGELGMVAAQTAFDSIPAEVRELFQIRKVFDELGRVADIQSNPPAGISDTEDRTSKGWELEGVYNPTRNWRFSFNVTKQFATRTNVRPVTQAWAEAFRATLDTPIVGGKDIAGDFAQYNITVGDLPAGGVGYWFPDRTGKAMFQSPWTDDEYTSLREWAEDRVFRDVASGVAAEGTQAPFQREWRINLITNFTFREGMLRGTAIGGAWRYQSAAIIRYPLIPNEFGDLVPDIANPFKDSSQIGVDAWIRYNRMVNLFGSRVNWTLQLNVRNLTASKNDFIPASYHQGGPLQGMVSYVRAAPPRTVFLTSTFRF